MPIFDFHCEACGQVFDQLVRNGESVKCPQCGGKKLEKLMSAPAGHVKGNASLPLMGGCPPSDAPPCSPSCCRLPS